METSKPKKLNFRYGKVAIASIVCTIINLIVLDTFSPATLVWLSQGVSGAWLNASGGNQVIYSEQHKP